MENGKTTKKRGPREIRRERGIPLIQVAAAARTTETTARLFEADPMAVASEAKRKALAAVYAKLEAGQDPRAA